MYVYNYKLLFSNTKYKLTIYITERKRFTFSTNKKPPSYYAMILAAFKKFTF